MTILDRYFGARILSTLIKTLVSLVLIFVLIDMMTHRRSDIFKYEVPWHVVILYYTAFVPQILCKFQMAAMAMLISALLVFGNAAQENEVTAALAGGISLRRLVRMPMIIAALLAVAVFALEELVGAKANHTVENIENRYFSKSTNNKRLPISWANLKGDWTCHIMKFNRTALTGEKVLMHSIRNDAVEQIQAHRIFWDPERNRWILEDGLWSIFDLTNPEWQREGFRITQWPAPMLETPDQLFALEEPADTKNATQLVADIRRAEHYDVPTHGAWTEFHAKFAQPTLAFIMIWLAIPFAMRLRRGGLAIGFGVSIVIALAYLILFRVTMGLGLVGRLSPPVAAWLANAVFFAIGLILFRRTPT